MLSEVLHSPVDTAFITQHQGGISIPQSNGCRLAFVFVPLGLTSTGIHVVSLWPQDLIITFGGFSVQKDKKDKILYHTYKFYVYASMWKCVRDGTELEDCTR